MAEGRARRARTAVCYDENMHDLAFRQALKAEPGKARLDTAPTEGVRKASRAVQGPEKAKRYRADSEDGFSDDGDFVERKDARRPAARDKQPADHLLQASASDDDNGHDFFKRKQLKRDDSKPVAAQPPARPRSTAAPALRQQQHKLQRGRASKQAGKPEAAPRETVRRSSRSAAAEATARMRGADSVPSDLDDDGSDAEDEDEEGAGDDDDADMDDPVTVNSDNDDDDDDGDDSADDMDDDSEDTGGRKRRRRPSPVARPRRACVRGAVAVIDGSDSADDDQEDDDGSDAGESEEDAEDGDGDGGSRAAGAKQGRARRGAAAAAPSGRGRVAAARRAAVISSSGDDGSNGDDDGGDEGASSDAAEEQSEGDAGDGKEDGDADADAVEEDEGDEARPKEQQKHKKQQQPERRARPVRQPPPKKALPPAPEPKPRKPKTNSNRPPAPVQRILRYNPEDKTYICKFEGMSYRAVGPVSLQWLQTHKPSLLSSFCSRGAEVEVDEEWLQVERVIAREKASKGRGSGGGSGMEYLVKWRGLEYSDATWEEAASLLAEEDQAAIVRFERFNAPPGARRAPNRNALRKAKEGEQGFGLPEFCSGRQLRSYQQDSVRWMANNYSCRRNCILGDEMGLGKTAQSISVLECIRRVACVPGPFLIVAPLTTLGHWQREVQTWTDMNVVLFAGSAADRALIVEHEFYHEGGAKGRPKFNVLLASYETLRQEQRLLKTIGWEAAVFDEAHKLKGLNSQTRATVQDLNIDWLLLLTGTPIQNNMLELYSILSLLDAEEYPTPEDFYERFGGTPGGAPPTVDQIKGLQAALAPVLLRRMKEDVETLPEKEEVIIWVEMAAEQRQYYKALYAGQIGALLGGGGNKNLPQMRNLAMELRKLCCHPVLCDGLEEDMHARRALLHEHCAAAGPSAAGAPNPEVELLVRSCGKMVLLHKLLPKLRQEGKRVLIFSQFVIMLNVLEDYCRLAGYPVERIDGSVKGRERQQAIDRFSKEEGDGAFVFLLSTRAGGQGITLTAADTCIIYDSDWNPQNDLQAMARCHRIGQSREVTVYRLITRDTYEEQLFSTASKKYGLDEAVLGFSASSDPEADAGRIAQLLRHGAHSLAAMDEKAKVSDQFAAEHIDQILSGRTEKRQIGSRAGNTFSVATFCLDEKSPARPMKPGRPPGGGGGSAAEQERQYWASLLPEAVQAHEEQLRRGPEVLGPRARRQVNYNDNDPKKDPKYEPSDGEEAKDGEEGKVGRAKKKQRPSDAEPPGWKLTEISALLDSLLMLGPGRWADVLERSNGGLAKRSVEEVAEAGEALLALIHAAADIFPKPVAAGEKDKAAGKAAQAQASGGRGSAAAAAGVDPDAGEDGACAAQEAAEAAGSGEPAAVGAGAGAAGAGASDDALLAQLLAAVQLPSCLRNLADPKRMRSVLKPAQAAACKAHLQLLADLYGIFGEELRSQQQAELAPPQQQHPAAAGVSTDTPMVDAGELQGAGAAGSADAAGSEPPVLPAVVSKPKLGCATLPRHGFSLPAWWSLFDDKALLQAALQHGYYMQHQRRTVEAALAIPGSRLCGMWRVVQPQAPPGVQGPTAADEASGAAAAAPGAQPDASVVPAAAGGGEPMEGVEAAAGDASTAAAAAAQATAQAAQPARHVRPTPENPVVLDQAAYKALLGDLTRRLKALVMATVGQLPGRAKAAFAPHRSKPGRPPMNRSGPSGVHRAPSQAMMHRTDSAAAIMPHHALAMADGLPLSRSGSCMAPEPPAEGLGAGAQHRAVSPTGGAARPLAHISPGALLQAPAQQQQEQQAGQGRGSSASPQQAQQEQQQAAVAPAKPSLLAPKPLAAGPLPNAPTPPGTGSGAGPGRPAGPLSGKGLKQATLPFGRLQLVPTQPAGGLTPPSGAKPADKIDKVVAMAAAAAAVVQKAAVEGVRPAAAAPTKQPPAGALAAVAAAKQQPPVAAAGSPNENIPIVLD